MKISLIYHRADSESSIVTKLSTFDVDKTADHSSHLYHILGSRDGHTFSIKFSRSFFRFREYWLLLSLSEKSPFFSKLTSCRVVRCGYVHCRIACSNTNLNYGVVTLSSKKNNFCQVKPILVSSVESSSIMKRLA
jgi:hypothetical protein